uniref:Uncharacterized protein n=1 Tax=Glossina brevipalpis TaxID=37001 RepID=A0A1A9WXX2_9MUSC
MKKQLNVQLLLIAFALGIGCVIDNVTLATVVNYPQSKSSMELNMAIRPGSARASQIKSCSMDGETLITCCHDIGNEEEVKPNSDNKLVTSNLHKAKQDNCCC